MPKIKKYERPLVPNFIKTDVGQFDIKDLTAEEINEFISIWRYELLKNWQNRKKLGMVKE